MTNCLFIGRTCLTALATRQLRSRNAGRSKRCRKNGKPATQQKQPAHTWRNQQCTPAAQVTSLTETQKGTENSLYHTHVHKLEVASYFSSVGSSSISYGGGPGRNLRPRPTSAASRRLRRLQVYLFLFILLAVSFPFSPFQTLQPLLFFPHLRLLEFLL